TIETQDFALVDDHTINGDVLLKGKTLNLNGRSLTIKGNLIHSGGNLLVNNGRLEVEGDYRIQKPDTESETGYTYSSGVLRMENVDDYILVHGDFVMDSRYGGFDTHSSSSYYIYNGDWLTAGTLELKGDLTQLSTSTTDTVSYLERYYPHENFQATVSHKVILSGESKQVISFEDAA
ncbi:hypothetical protein Q4575_19755, partial [Psychrosphaera sp. 1_MG-2023]|uniref:hypothetical protein n=1 Tax=Psychrosphaera sp. 1_MG-2023 TaxID=3062643 RepID=UPI0026E2FEF7